MKEAAREALPWVSGRRSGGLVGRLMLNAAGFEEKHHPEYVVARGHL